ncbi:MAG: hypothetical protein NTX36_03185 [Proteobacteria bacterium]|jgi:hypothetical protein|nr:hypothetical protein [Pseudomonadota bacterium]
MPNEDLIVDLDKELTSLFDKEEMFAFFNFEVNTPSEKIVPGLCKVTKPKVGEAQSVYFSLLFILDIQDNETWTEVDALINNIPWDSFERYSERIKYVLPMLSRSLSTGNYFKEVCIYITSINDLTKQYIFNKIYSILPVVTNFKTDDLTFWDDLK